MRLKEPEGKVRLRVRVRVRVRVSVRVGVRVRGSVGVRVRVRVRVRVSRPAGRAEAPTLTRTLILTPTQASTRAEESRQVVESLAAIEVEATDITGNDLAKTHARYLAGGRPGAIPGERIIRFEFPETPGALASFLNQLRSDWYITLLHYRNHGGQVRVGVRVRVS